MKEGRTPTPPLQAADQESLSDAEIEAIRASESAPPPLKSHLPAQPIPLVRPLAVRQADCARLKQQ